MADTEFDDISVDSESFQFEEGENSAEPHSDSENSSALFDSDGEPIIDDQPREIEQYMLSQLTQMMNNRLMLTLHKLSNKLDPRPQDWTTQTGKIKIFKQIRK
jgi:hypothetical protein